ncbi:hypothetical protein [Actinomadura napierensis]|uniref:Uncharacterized protein n=1 Tax=Actinomadura napierensis TaxID=267854 RepID=A0ABN2Y288_9ACTN
MEITRQAALTDNPFDYVALQYQWHGEQSLTDFVRATAPAL